MTDPLLSVQGLCKYFPVFSQGLRRKRIGWVRAVDEVSFDLLPGRTLGLVGESGCGKTTTARSILRALSPTAGKVVFQSDAGPVDLAQVPDKELKPLRTQMQMIFQDPFSSLNPRMTIERVVGEPLLIHGLDKGSERTDRIASILSRVGLSPDHMKRYPHEFSGGQRQRIGIASPTSSSPTICRWSSTSPTRSPSCTPAASSSTPAPRRSSTRRSIPIPRRCSRPCPTPTPMCR